MTTHAYTQQQRQQQQQTVMTHQYAIPASSTSGGRFIEIQTPYEVLLQRGISGIYTPSVRRGRWGIQEQYYSCDINGHKIPLQPYTSINRTTGTCTPFYYNPLSTDVWVPSNRSGEPVILTLGRLPHQVYIINCIRGRYFLDTLYINISFTYIYIYI